MDTETRFTTIQVPNVGKLDSCGVFWAGYWINGLNVVSYHFEHSFKTVPKKMWYSEGGKKMTGGGYSKKLKRSRIAVRGRTFNLATDFTPRERECWEGGGIKVPDAKLYMQSSA